MLEGISGDASVEKVLLYLEQYEEGYAAAIARTFDGLTLKYRSIAARPEWLASLARAA